MANIDALIAFQPPPAHEVALARLYARAGLSVEAIQTSKARRVVAVRQAAVWLLVTRHGFTDAAAGAVVGYQSRPAAWEARTLTERRIATGKWPAPLLRGR